MMNFTAFLLVLMLTGSPVASIVCVTECQHEPAASTHCHGGMVTSDRPMMSASSGCDGTISDGPYVVEHRGVPGAAVLTITLSPTARQLVGTDARAVLASAANAWLKPPLVLRL